MNYLAHIYLSYDKDEIMIGNFIADAIKGSKYKTFPPEIQKGILLHRNIDTFTDQHEIVRQSKRRLHERYNHFSGIIIDLFYDHFLAKYWSEYSNTDLFLYTKKFYDLLDDRFDELPENIKHIVPSLKKYNWLYNYRSFEGMQDVLNGMNRRTGNISNMHLAIEDLRENYALFHNDFKLFFDDIIDFVNQKNIELKI